MTVPPEATADAAAATRPRSIPEASVARLAVYLRMLGELAEQGAETVSSDELAAATGVNSAKLRKDLSYIGSYGIRGVGYEVAPLLHQLERALGLRPPAVGRPGRHRQPRARAGRLRRVRPPRLPGDRAVRRRPRPGRHPHQRRPGRAGPVHPADLPGARRHHRHDRHPGAGRAGRVRPAGPGRGPVHPQLRAGGAAGARRGRGAQGGPGRRAADPGLPRGPPAPGRGRRHDRGRNDRAHGQRRTRCPGWEGCGHERAGGRAVAPQRPGRRAGAGRGAGRRGAQAARRAAARPATCPRSCCSPRATGSRSTRSSTPSTAAWPTSPRCSAGTPGCRCPS